MNIFWITNIPIGDITEVRTKPMGGLWMDALLKQLRSNENIRLIIVTTSNVETTVCQVIDGIKYYLVPGGFPVYYKRPRKIAEKEWEEIFSADRPDVIQVWGTEYSHGVYALEVAKKMGIPSVIYIQGIMKTIANYATGCLPTHTILKYITLRDIYRGQLLARQREWFKKRAKAEKKLISLSGSVVIENKWAEAYCKSINPELKIFKVPLNINETFYQEKWSLQKMVPHTILCNASGSAYKGLHVLLKALVMIKEQYPDVKLYVPGGSLIVKGFLSRQKRSGYSGYITDFIKKNSLVDNVIFTGYLTQKELAIKLSEANVFVLPSAIENHSSSLKEAMAVGTPSVASLVGGIPEYFPFGVCGFSYRYEEYECIAQYVCDLFADPDLCVKFSNNSIAVANQYSNIDITAKITDMYQKLSTHGR